MNIFSDKKRKAKRPTRGIYTPPSILRQKQLEHDDVKSHDVIPETENWADEIECHSSTSDSKENSVERELEVLRAGLSHPFVNGAGALAILEISIIMDKIGKNKTLNISWF